MSVPYFTRFFLSQGLRFSGFTNDLAAYYTKNMLSQPKSVKFDQGGGREVTIGTGKLARQADGAVTVSQGNCVILATVVANKDPKEGQDFFPLSVDYQEKFASAGRIPGSFFKREARLNDYEILTSRLIDRALRPLFPEDYLCDGRFIGLSCCFCCIGCF